MRYSHRKQCQFILFQFSVNNITVYHFYISFFFQKVIKRFKFLLLIAITYLTAIISLGQGFLKSESESCLVVSSFLGTHGLYNPWNSPGQNTKVGSLPLLQWIFPTQESAQGLLYCRRILYQLSYHGFLRKINFLIMKKV